MQCHDLQLEHLSKFRFYSIDSIGLFGPTESDAFDEHAGHSHGKLSFAESN